MFCLDQLSIVEMHSHVGEFLATNIANAVRRLAFGDSGSQRDFPELERVAVPDTTPILTDTHPSPHARLEMARSDSDVDQTLAWFHRYMSTRLAVKAAI
jgi:hypothetical protein